MPNDILKMMTNECSKWIIYIIGQIIILMASLVDEQTTSDIQDIKKKVIDQLKTYTFFIFYEREQLEEEETMSLQKLTFKLKEEKSLHYDKYGDSTKNIQLHFCDIHNQYQVDNSLIDLKTKCQQNKTKLIFISDENAILQIIMKAKLYHIQISNIPLCLYTNSLRSDFSHFLGWGHSHLKQSSLSIAQIQPNVRKWVESPTQKIDMWALQIKVDQVGGHIHKIQQGKIKQDYSTSKNHQEYFLSSFSLGYHPQLMMDFDEKQGKKNGFFNRFLYSFQGLKKFCCVGSPSMKTSTGIARMAFSDQKGQHQILKQFRQFEGDEEEDMIEAKKPINKRKALSIVGSNIDRFDGEKLSKANCRMNDGKLQLLTFSSLKEYRTITSIAGQMNIKLSPDHVVFLQVNDSYYRLERPLELRIKHHSKVKVMINKEILSC